MYIKYWHTCSNVSGNYPHLLLPSHHPSRRACAVSRLCDYHRALGAILQNPARNADQNATEMRIQSTIMVENHGKSWATSEKSIKYQRITILRTKMVENTGKWCKLMYGKSSNMLETYGNPRVNEHGNRKIIIFRGIVRVNDLLFESQSKSPNVMPKLFADHMTRPASTQPLFLPRAPWETPGTKSAPPVGNEFNKQIMKSSIRASPGKGYLHMYIYL